MRLFEIAQPNIKAKLAGTKIPSLLFHGSNTEITKFRQGPQGVFFSPHEGWAQNYGNVITRVYVMATKVYVPDHEDPFGEEVLDALFDRDYDALAGYIKKLQANGYDALQTQTDSEMVCAFSNSKIYSADTGEQM